MFEVLKMMKEKEYQNKIFLTVKERLLAYLVQTKK